MKRFDFTDEFDKSIKTLTEARKSVAKEMVKVLIDIIENKKRHREKNIWIKFDVCKDHWVAWTSVKTLFIFSNIGLPTLIKEWEIRANAYIKVDYIQSNDFVEFLKVEYLLYGNSIGRVLQSPQYPHRLKENVFVTRHNENKCKSCKKRIVDDANRKYCKECSLIAREKNLIQRLLRWHKSEIVQLKFSRRGIERVAKEAVRNHGIDWFESRMNVYEQYHSAEKWAFWGHIMDENIKTYWKKLTIRNIPNVGDEMNEYWDEYNLILKKGVARQRSFAAKYKKSMVVSEPESEPGFSLFSLPSEEELTDFAQKMAPFASMAAPYK